MSGISVSMPKVIGEVRSPDNWLVLSPESCVATGRGEAGGIPAAS